MIPNALEQLERTMREMNDFMHRRQRTVFGRFPLLFSLLATFGVAMVLYGIEHTLDKTPLFHDYPALSFFAGILILVFTGTLYKRLDKKID